MNYDAFAFANQQLAAMLKSGIPLEGGLRQLSSTMQQGRLRVELEKLQEKLSQGVPLKDAITSCRLPEFYVRMMQLGAQSNDLPAILTLLADYYQRRNALWTRLQGLLVYPAIVLGCSLLLSVFLALTLGHFARNIAAAFEPSAGMSRIDQLNIMLFTPVVFICLLMGAFGLALGIPKIRHWLRWRLSVFARQTSPVSPLHYNCC